MLIFVQGTIQWLKIKCDEPFRLEQIRTLNVTMQFQGGFSCKRCELEAFDDLDCIIASTRCYPEDNNSAQKFCLTFDSSQQDETKSEVHELKLTFKEPTDLFGRITLYSLDIE